MTLDQQALNQLAEDAFAHMVLKNHGEAGGWALRSVMATLRNVYQLIEPAECKGRIIVFQQVEMSRPGIKGMSTGVADLRVRSESGLTLEVLKSGEIRLWLADEEIDVVALSERAVVYVFENGAEFFWANREGKQVANVYPGVQSLFAIPSFHTLQDALLFYRTHLVRTCKCRLLQKAWMDENRLFFHEKPEKDMRQSLEQFLVSTLREGGNVRPEQNVDETHPVDLRVNFELSKRVALIEIKWLGKSKHEDGELATEYSASRAVDGARQLAEYLDSNHQYAADEIAHGYLVIIDGRRRGLIKDSESVSESNGLHYASAEIDFCPKYHEDRRDFAEPLRMFAEPICSNEAAD